MSYIGVPQACESVALKLVDAANNLRALGQAIVRPDLDESQPKAMALNSVRSTIKCLQELELMIEPKKAKS
jgi:hypothetical protein